MTARGQNAKALNAWRVAKTIRPGQRGAIKLERAYGDELLCVRYRENGDGTERLTTIELMVERAVIQKRDDPIVAFKLKHNEVDLRKWAMAAGARYNGRTRMWHLRRSAVLRKGLRSRIAVALDEIYQEQVHA
jgi:hypothetical protein